MRALPQPSASPEKQRAVPSTGPLIFPYVCGSPQHPELQRFLCAPPLSPPPLKGRELAGSTVNTSIHFATCWGGRGEFISGQMALAGGLVVAGLSVGCTCEAWVLVCLLPSLGPEKSRWSKAIGPGPVDLGWPQSWQTPS